MSQEYQKQYRKKNRKALKGYHKRYRKRNREKLRNKMREYRAKYPARQHLANAKYYAKNREKSLKRTREYQERTDYQRRYYEANRERIKERSRKYRLANPEQITQYGEEYLERQKRQNPNLYRERNWKRLYGITIDDYAALFLKQKGVCAICKSAKTNKRHGVLCIDHDHRTKAVRGLLCNTCNRALGLLKDDIEVLKAAVRYLSKVKKKRGRRKK